MFEKASRLKLRFETTRGLMSAEDLWDLPLTSPKGNPNLDDLAIQLNKVLKETTTESFVKKSLKNNDVVQLKFDIVKKVIDVKMAEAEIAEKKQVNADRKQKLLSILAEKQDAELKGKSAEELQKLINEL